MCFHSGYCSFTCGRFFHLLRFLLSGQLLSNSNVQTYFQVKLCSLNGRINVLLSFIMMRIDNERLMRLKTNASQPRTKPQPKVANEPVKSVFPAYTASPIKVKIAKQQKQGLNISYTLPQLRSSPPEVFLGKGILKICSKFTGEHPHQSVILIKLQSSFLEITLRHECSPVNLLHIFRTTFYKNNSWGLLLKYTKFLHDVTKHNATTFGEKWSCFYQPAFTFPKLTTEILE